MGIIETGIQGLVQQREELYGNIKESLIPLIMESVREAEDSKGYKQYWDLYGELSEAFGLSQKDYVRIIDDLEYEEKFLSHTWSPAVGGYLITKERERELERARALELKIIRVPDQADITLAEKLLQEVGGSQIVKFVLSPACPTELNEDVKSYAEAVRGIVRFATLQRAGSAGIGNPAKEEGDDSTAKFLRQIVIGRDITNQRIFRGKLDESPDVAPVNDLLLPPINRAYEWHHVAYWNLGDFQDLLDRFAPDGYLVIPETETLLFTDEIEMLQADLDVTVTYRGGLGFGFLTNNLDIYGVRNKTLYRVWAQLID